jgi:AcrR family transcriptional regulator
MPKPRYNYERTFIHNIRSLFQLTQAMKSAKSPKKKAVRRRPQARGAVTRERLLEVAFDQFVRHGFHGTSMRQIASATGMAVGGIYNHFGSKDEIFAAVLEANHPYRVIEAALQELSAPTLEAFTRETSARLELAIAGRRERLLPLMFIELVEFQGRHLQAVAEGLLPKVLSFVQQFDQSAENRRPLPSLVVLRAFINFMIGHFIIETVMGRSPLFQQMEVDWLAGTVDIFLHGVLVDEAPARKQQRAGDGGRRTKDDGRKKTNSLIFRPPTSDF